MQTTTDKQMPKKHTATTYPRNKDSCQISWTLEELARFNFNSLEVLYRHSSPTESLKDLDGPLMGRMLAVRGNLGGGWSMRALARLSGSRLFPWRGKTMLAEVPRFGNGINRVLLGRRFDLFAFRTRIGASELDGKPAIILDYDLPENPAFIRLIHDEVRQLGPNLFFGPAMVRCFGKPRLVLFFALDRFNLDRS